MGLAQAHPSNNNNKANTFAACRLCGNHPEAVEHLVSGCSKLAGTLYKQRHDNVLIPSLAVVSTIIILWTAVFSGSLNMDHHLLLKMNSLKHK